MKTKTINLYEFDELSPDIQENVINNECEINLYFNDWYENTYDDAKMIGLEITGFDLDYREITGKFIFDPLSVANEIIKEHGKDCETFKTAQQYLVDAKRANNETIEETNEYFLESLLNDYRIILQHEYDYLTSRKAIIETIKADELTFTIDGKLENI